MGHIRVPGADATTLSAGGKSRPLQIHLDFGMMSGVFMVWWCIHNFFKK